MEVRLGTCAGSACWIPRQTPVYGVATGMKRPQIKVGEYYHCSLKVISV